VVGNVGERKRETEREREREAARVTIGPLVDDSSNVDDEPARATFPRPLSPQCSPVTPSATTENKLHG